MIDHSLYLIKTNRLLWNWTSYAAKTCARMEFFCKQKIKTSNVENEQYPFLPPKILY